MREPTNHAQQLPVHERGPAAIVLGRELQEEQSDGDDDDLDGDVYDGDFYDEDEDEEPPEFDDWGAGDWERYFDPSWSPR